jgi:hypothetical protein
MARPLREGVEALELTAKITLAVIPLRGRRSGIRKAG